MLARGEGCVISIASDAPFKGSTPRCPLRGQQSWPPRAHSLVRTAAGAARGSRQRDRSGSHRHSTTQPFRSATPRKARTIPLGRVGIPLDSQGGSIPCQSAQRIRHGPDTDEARRYRLIFIGAFAHMLLTLLGAAGERCGLDRTLKSNTSKKRQMSLYNQGLHWYMAHPRHARGTFAPPC